jgi:hypothetical protein
LIWRRKKGKRWHSKMKEGKKKKEERKGHRDHIPILVCRYRPAGALKAAKCAQNISQYKALFLS